MIPAFQPILRTLVSQYIIYKIEQIPECGFHNASEDLGKILRIIIFHGDHLFIFHSSNHFSPAVNLWPF